MSSVIKESIINTVLRNLEKKIVIFGAGEVAENFYKKNKDNYSIIRCVSNYQRECGEKALLGELDIVPYSKSDIKDDEYIVICGEYSFKTLTIQLDADGLRMFDDYLEYQLADAIYSRKKLALFRGSCILRDVYECMIKVPSFVQEYACVFVQDKQATTKFENPLLKYCAKICDCYIYSHRIMSVDPIFRIQKNELSEECIMISVTNQSFSGYWPQADPDITHRNPYWIHSYNIKRDRFFYHNMFLYCDLAINAFIDQDKSSKEIIKEVSSLDFYSMKDIERNVRRAVKSMRIADQGADVCMSDYIEDTYKQKRVFQNFEHMDKCVVWEYVRRVLKKLEIDIKECDYLEEISPRYVHHGCDIPIYPSVIEGLELDWMPNDNVYEIIKYDGIHYMTFEEYIEDYIKFMQLSKKVTQRW